MATIRIRQRAPGHAHRSAMWPASGHRAETTDLVGLLALQRLAGNRAVTALITKGEGPETAAGRALRSARGPHSPMVVQRVLSVADKPVSPGQYEAVRDFCEKRFDELKTEELKKLEADTTKNVDAKAVEKKTIEAALTWTNDLAAKLKDIIDDRVEIYSVGGPDKLVEALRGYAQSKGSFPTWFTPKDIDQKKAERGHELRQEMRYWGVNQLAPEQMPKTASAFHQLRESDVAPLEPYGYGWMRKKEEYHLTRERGQNPPEARLHPFGENSLDESKAKPGQLFGYTASVGSGESRELPFALVKVLKGTRRKAPERDDRDATYGGWEALENMTRGHINPHLANADVLDPRPTKRMRSKDYRGSEDFTPEKTSQSPLNFYPENMAYGQGIRKWVEGKIVTQGGTLRHHNLYGPTPPTVETQVEGKGGGRVVIPYPGQVILDANLPQGATFYEKEPMTAPGRFTAKFENSPDVDYSSGTVDSTTRKMQYERFTGNPQKKTRQKLKKGKTGGGAREHFKGNEIDTTDVPTASIFKTDPYRFFKPAGDYLSTEEYKPAHRASVPGYMSPPPSPLLTLGDPEKTVILDGKYNTGEKTPDGARITWAEYDEKTKKTTCTIVDYQPFDTSSLH